MSNTSDQTTQQSKTRLIIGEVGVDTETGIIGKGHSYDNGKTFTVDDTIYGRIYNADDHGRIWQGIQDKVAKVVEPAKSAANSAVAYANDAIKNSRVNSQAIDDINSAVTEAKQGANDAMSRAISAWDVAIGAKSAVTDFDPLLKSAQSDAGKALTQIADTANALSDAKTQFGSDVAAAKELANTAQTTADSAVAVASDASSNATVAIQTASGASLTATNAQGDATIAKQTASEAKVQASNAESDYAQLSIRANKIEANVANNSGAIASVQQTANGLTTTVAKLNARDGINLLQGTSATENEGPLDFSGIAVTAGDNYTFSGFMSSPSTSGVIAPYINFYDSSGTLLKQLAKNSNAPVTSGTSFAITGVAPTNAVTARVLLAKSDGSITLNYRSLKFEHGSQATPWTPAPTDASVVYNSLKVTVDQTSNIINDPKTGLNATYQTATGNATTISNVKSDVYQLETTANGLTSRVGNLESKTNTQETAIEQNKNAIALKAAQTDVDTLKGNVTDLQATITTQADEIKSKVTQSDVTGMLTDYATQSYTQSLVTQKADDWNLNLTKLQTDVNAIKTTGGGVNLVQNTSTDIVVDDTANTGTQGWRYNAIPINADLKVGDKITVSVENVTMTGKGDLSKWGAILYSTDISEARSDTYAINSGKNGQVTITVTSINDSNKQTALLIYSGRVSDTEGKKAVFHHLMVEKGTVSHDWSPAPSDMATVTSVTNLSATVDGIQAQVYNSDGTSKITQLSNLIATKVSQGDYNSQINQLNNDINLRVKSADLISQINLQAGTALIQSNKLVLDAKTTVFTGDAFIPDAYISTLNADKLMFYGSDGTSATMGASVAQYDDDKTKSTINLQYSGGIEIHSSDQQGSILTMHDNTIRLASKSWGDNPNAYQYSGFYAAPNYSLMNTYHRDGTTSGVAIDDNQIHIYGSSKDQQLGALQADVGWYSINGKTGSLTGDQISLKAGNTQAVLTDNNININNASDTNDKNYDVAIHVKGWAEMTGWFTCMGLTQTSLLSTKTRIEPLDTAKALELINSADVATYQYKQEVAHGGTKRHASVIIDDVNDVARYQTPDEIISEDRQGRNDGDIVGYLMGAVQELTKRLKTLESKVG